MDRSDSRSVPIPLGGEYQSGDPSDIPDGFCLVCRNMLLRPRRIEARPPFVYDNLMTINSLVNFDDQTNKVSRLLAANTTPQAFLKATSGETFSGAISSLTGSRTTDFANYRGKVYMARDNGSGVPTSICVYDGSTISASPFNSTIAGRLVTAYLDRIVIAYPRVTVTPHNSIANAYVGAGTWSLQNVTARALSDGTRTTYRITPTITTTSANLVAAILTLNYAASATPTKIAMRQDFRSGDAGVQTPLTITIQMDASSQFVLTPYALGNIAVVNGLIWRCTTAGTSANPLVPLLGNVGDQITDGTVVWTAEQNSILCQKFITLPTLTEEQEWTSYAFDATIPWLNQTWGVVFRIDFAHRDWDGTATIDIDRQMPVDMAFKDGLADGDPGKKNRGFQVTSGDFRFPFVNTESAATAALDMNAIICTEALDVKRIRAVTTFELPEQPGYPTAATTLWGRYLVFKRAAFWVFTGNQDQKSLDVIPIRRERVHKNIGCVGPRALDSIDSSLYFIGEDTIYVLRSSDSEPEDICGDAMRETIMERGSDWVESQATYNMPILRIDQKNKEVWVYTQKGKLFCYNLARKQWTSHDVMVGGVGVEVADMMFSPNTRKMYVAWGGYGLSRLDFSAANAKDTIDSLGTTYDVTQDIVARPYEPYAPREDTTVDSMGAFHLATATQANSTLSAFVSMDRGVTFPYELEFDFDLDEPRISIDLFESAPSLTLKLSRVGDTGATAWAVSKFDAEIIGGGQEWPQTRPTLVDSSL